MATASTAWKRNARV